MTWHQKLETNKQLLLHGVKKKAAIIPFGRPPFAAPAFAFGPQAALPRLRLPVQNGRGCEGLPRHGAALRHPKRGAAHLDQRVQRLGVLVLRKERGGETEM